MSHGPFNAKRILNACVKAIETNAAGMPLEHLKAIDALRDLALYSEASVVQVSSSDFILISKYYRSEP